MTRRQTAAQRAAAKVRPAVGKTPAATTTKTTGGAKYHRSDYEKSPIIGHEFAIWKTQCAGGKYKAGDPAQAGKKGTTKDSWTFRFAREVGFQKPADMEKELSSSAVLSAAMEAANAKMAVDGESRSADVGQLECFVLKALPEHPYALYLQHDQDDPRQHQRGH